MSRIKLYIAIVDGGDGEHHSEIFPSKEAGRKSLHVDEDDFDEYGYLVEWDETILDTSEYEVVG